MLLKGKFATYCYKQADDGFVVGNLRDIYNLDVYDLRDFSWLIDRVYLMVI